LNDEEKIEFLIKEYGFLYSAFIKLNERVKDVEEGFLQLGINIINKGEK